MENTKCQAGGQTLFKCFKMQITTGFKFSLPPLVKTKVEARLPKSHKADSLFFWGLAQARQLRKGLELMAPSQTDRASWAAGKAGSVATRIGSPKPGQGSGVAGWRDRETQMAGRLENARGRAARVASYLSGYGQLGKGRPDRNQNLDEEKTTSSWFMLSKFFRDGDCKSRTFLSPVLRMASWSGDAQRVPHPPENRLVFLFIGVLTFI